MDKKILKCNNLTKNFGKFCALNRLNLSIEEGEIFGLLGGNGAGKTTLLRCILKFIQPEEGEVFFNQGLLSPKQIQTNFGFLPESFQPPMNLTGYQFLSFLCRGVKVPNERVNTLLKEVKLINKKDTPIKNYSRGMLQRLGIAVALLKDPEIIILDEPTLGLDPIGQVQILDFLNKLNSEGKTIFFSSHFLNQVEKICHRVGIIHRGSLKYTGEIDELLKKHQVSTLQKAFFKQIQ